MKQLSVLIIVLYVAIQLAAAQTTYYVSPSGSDGSAGTSAAPFRSIQRAADTVNAGDTVIVRDGVYSNAGASGIGSKLITVTRGGTSSSPVTFRSENKWGAVVDGLNNTTAEAWVVYANYVRIEGFDIKGFSDDAVQNYGGGQFLVISGNHIHHIGRYCTDTGIGRDGIFVGKSNVTIERNLIHDIGRFGPGENGCNPTTFTYQNNDHGIYIAGDDFGGAHNVTIVNNIFYNVKHGWSIHVYPTATSNLAVLNNTFAFPNPWRTGHIIFAAVVTNSRIENNIFYQPSTVAINFDIRTGHSNVAVRNNITYQATIGDATPSGVTFSGNQNSTDPMLSSPATFDFRLLNIGSPAVDAALSDSGASNDYVGTQRPQGPESDVGAYERVSDIIPPPPPPPPVVTVPDMVITMSQSAKFMRGRTAAYTIMVSNVGDEPTSGVVSVTDRLPVELVGTIISGTGWTCTLGTLTCTRSDVLAPGASYPSIRLNVSVQRWAAAWVTNEAWVSGGGEVNMNNNLSSISTHIKGR
jgi:uncharacterized repeat protein (TIGR01451 family)